MLRMNSIHPSLSQNAQGKRLVMAPTVGSTEGGLVLKNSDSVDELSSVMRRRSPTVLRSNYCWNINPSFVTQELHECVEAHSDDVAIKHDPRTFQ